MRAARSWAGALVLATLLAGCGAGWSAARHPAPAPAGSGGAARGSAGTSPLQPAAQANPYLFRVPAFPPAPAAEPIALPGGPLAPFFSRLPTSAPVAFLTMDDGWTQSPEAIKLMEAANIPFTMFLLAPVASQGADFFRQLVLRGGTVGDHTIHHPSLRGRSYAVQYHEMCDSAPTLTSIFGTRPRLFRPPYGEYDSTTLRVAHDCGYAAVLNWSETVDKGIVRYQTAAHRIEPGDIILMHFRPAFVEDVLAALHAIQAAGLTPALLGDYLPTPSV